MELFEKSLSTLELPAVLTMLAAEAVSEPAKTRALELRPSCSEYEIKKRQAETSAACAMMTVKGTPSFSGPAAHASRKRSVTSSTLICGLRS